MTSVQKDAELLGTLHRLQEVLLALKILLDGRTGHLTVQHAMRLATTLETLLKEKIGEQE